MSGARSLSPRTAMVHGSEVITIERFIMEQERLHPEATGELSNLLYDICLAAKIISRHVRRAGLADILGAAGAVNVSGDLQQKLDRSEEHTSELQSQSNLVCRLLLEKKKKDTAKSQSP